MNNIIIEILEIINNNKSLVEIKMIVETYFKALMLWMIFLVKRWSESI